MSSSITPLHLSLSLSFYFLQDTSHPELPIKKATTATNFAPELPGVLILLSTRPALTYRPLSVTMRSKFKDEHPFEKRKAEAERIRQKYADRIPVSIFDLGISPKEGCWLQPTSQTLTASLVANGLVNL